MISGLAHTAVCVTDLDAAAVWYAEKLEMTVLAPPFRMEGAAIERDMGELIPPPVVVRAAIMGFDRTTDNVIELIEYPELDREPDPDAGRYPLTRPGPTHIGLLCDDIVKTRADLERRGVKFLTSEPADIAGLRTTWFSDPWGTIFILLEKKRPDRPYWRQPWD